MGKKTFFGYLGLLVLSVVVTYLASLVEMILSKNVLSGSFGFPFDFSYSSFFGGGSINYIMLLFDISFWLVILIGSKLLFKKAKRS